MKKKPRKLIPYRREWTRNPATKVKTSDKIYNRNKAKQEFRKDINSDNA